MKEKLSGRGWEIISTDEKTWWHTYVYAWRLVFLNLPPSSPPPTDPRQEWYFPRLVEEVLAGYKRGRLWKEEQRRQARQSEADDDRSLKYRHFIAQVYRRAHAAGETLPAGMADDDPRLAAVIHKFGIDSEHRRQDDERRNFKGTDAEGVALCARQIRANTDRFVFNTRTYR